MTADSRSGRRSKRWNYAEGVVLLLCVVLLWDASAFITNYLATGSADNEGEKWNKPFAMTYFCTSSFVVYLIKPGFLYFRDRRKPSLATNTNDERTRLLSSPANHLTGSSDDIESTPRQHTPKDIDKLTTKQTARLAMYFCLAWFSANYALNAGLAYTSVSSSTIIASTSGFFTLLFGHFLGFNRFSLGRLVAVSLSLAGVMLVTKADGDLSKLFSMISLAEGRGDTVDRRPAPLLGDFLSLISAILYASYLACLKVGIEDEDRISMPLFFGFVGLFNLVAFWPILILLHYTGVEKFVWPNSNAFVLGIVVNSAITVVSDFIYVLAMLKTSPLLVTVGCSLTIPLAILGDALIQGPHVVNPKIIAGACLVMVAFACVSYHLLFTYLGLISSTVIGIADKRDADKIDADVVRHVSPA